MADFLDRDRTPENYWRAVILFGQNVASSKFALAKSLIELSCRDNQTVTLEELVGPHPQLDMMRVWTTEDVGNERRGGPALAQWIVRRWQFQKGAGQFDHLR